MRDNEKIKVQSSIVEITAVESILFTGITNTELRAEIYAQIVRQLTHNPDQFSKEQYSILFFLFILTIFLVHRINMAGSSWQ